ncbi:MAG TPA: oligosaccharide flippase family protein [Ramlibacter sp.]|jgi:O-antigen/teichoic acid export membrane protein|nr:oligosaccharide flippase family protein [Ramlibacter sp.]
MSSVKRNVAANYVATGWTAVVGLTVLPFYLRYLGIESYGLISFFVTLQAWMFLLDLGLTPTFNREVARFTAGGQSLQGLHDLFRSLEVVYAGIALLMALALAGSSGWLVTGWLQLQTLSAGSASQALALMGLVVAVQWMGALYRSAILGLQHQVWLSVLTAGISTLRAVATVAVLALLSATVVAFVITQFAVSLLETLLLAWRVRDRFPAPPAPPRFSIGALRGIWRFASSLALVTVLGTLLMQVDKLILAKLLPLDAFGYFSLAVAVAAALGSLVVPVHNAAYPRLCELVAAGNERQLAQEYHRFSQLVALSVLPATLVLCLFSQEVLLLWTQDAQTARVAGPILSVWVLGTALNALMHVPYAAQLAHGWTRLAIVVNVIAVALIVPAMLYWVPRHGALAAAWIWLGLNAGYTVFAISAMHRRIIPAEKWKWYLQDNLLPALAAVAVLAPMALAHRQLGPLTRSGELAFLLAAGVLATLAAAASTSTGHGILRAAAFLVKRPKFL